MHQNIFIDIRRELSRIKNNHNHSQTVWTYHKIPNFLLLVIKTAKFNYLK
jgi:hypothetical protein